MKRDLVTYTPESIASSFKRFFPKSKKAGKPPGTIHYTGKKKVEKVTIDLIDYTKSKLEEKRVKDFKEIAGYNLKNSTTWVNVNGVHDISIIKDIGKEYKLHPLILEDIASVNQRAKVEDYKDNLFLVLKMITFDSRKKSINSEQISIVLGKRFVVSFQEDEGDVFDNIRKRLREGKRIRSFGCDYLVYSMLDSIVDGYFSVLDELGEHISELEQEIVSDPKPSTQNEIYRLKREVIYLRKTIWPLREVLSSFQRNEFKLMEKETLVFMRDVYDHAIQVIDTIETFRDMLSSMLDSYLTSVSNKMNEVMKVLTVISTIFIPLTFIVGVYGMNFKFMPELGMRWFYPALWLFMVFIVLVMISLFKRKRWM